MNAFLKHQDNIRFSYRCFDRILLNGLIQPFQQPERVIGFFNTYRQLYPVSREFSVTSLGIFRSGSRTARRDWGAPIWKLPKGDATNSSGPTSEKQNRTKSSPS